MTEEENGNNSQNRRKLRFRDPERDPIRFSYQDSFGEHKTLHSLLINESHGGMCCIFVGDASFRKGDILTWIETENIHTRCSVAWCRKIEGEVVSLGIQILD
ncbi:MAG: hypothetical protein HQL31_08765 [Planctomycetes bacterium]|nr:hypothetical protein [Planctomycetota bacterium]